MIICSYNHEEIVHEGVNCPLCDAIDEMYDLRNTIQELEDKIQKLEDKIPELERNQS